MPEIRRPDGGADPVISAFTHLGGLMSATMKDQAQHALKLFETSIEGEYGGILVLIAPGPAEKRGIVQAHFMTRGTPAGMPEFPTAV